MAFRNRDKDAARAHLEAALRAADRLHFSLADVIARVEFKPERRQEPEYYQMLGRREATIAGEPAVIVDYTVKVPERQRRTPRGKRTSSTTRTCSLPRSSA